MSLIEDSEAAMSLADANEELLTHFLEEVWNDGDIEASDKYIAPKYTIHHDPGDPWEKHTPLTEGSDNSSFFITPVLSANRQ